MAAKKEIGEKKLIEKYLKKLAKNSKSARHNNFNLEDDICEISCLKGEKFVVSKDLIAENIHFCFKEGGARIAEKLMVANISDIVAKGAKPKFFMLGFCKNSLVDAKFCDEFFGQIAKIQDEFDLILLGGDTIKSNSNLILSLTIFGILDERISTSRQNAKDGDLIFHTGIIGDSFLEFEKISQKSKDYEITKLKKLSEFMQELTRRNLINSSCDISDGIFNDLRNICQASNLDAEILQENIGLSQNGNEFLQKNPNKFFDLVAFGEDFEVIFSCLKENKEKILNIAKNHGIRLNQIGFFTAKNKGEIVLKNSQNNKIAIEKYGYEH